MLRHAIFKTKSRVIEDSICHGEEIEDCQISSFDKQGNLTSKTTGIGNNASHTYYSYDGYNRLSGLMSESSSALYLYNLEGLRKSKTVNGEKTEFSYSDGNIVCENTPTNSYTYYRGSEFLGYIDSANNQYFYNQNTHGDVISIRDATGKVLKDYTYSPYGEKQHSTQISDLIYHWQPTAENIHNPFEYCGEYADSESELIYLRNRYYDPSVGRFITEDPIGDGVNWYVYCGGNPINYADPTGLEDVNLVSLVLKFGGTVLWDSYSRAAIVDFGSAGRKVYYTAERESKPNDSYSSKWAFLKLEEDGQYHTYVDDNDLKADFGITDFESRYSDEFNAQIRFVLFHQQGKNYQRFTIGYNEIEYKKVNYQNFNFFTPSGYASRYEIGYGKMSQLEVDRLNKENQNLLRDAITVYGSDGAYFNSPASSKFAIADYLLGNNGYAPQIASTTDSRVQFRQDVYYFKNGTTERIK